MERVEPKPGPELTQEEIDPRVFACMVRIGMSVEDINKNSKNPTGLDEFRRLNTPKRIRAWAYIVKEWQKIMKSTTEGHGDNPIWEEQLYKLADVLKEEFPLSREDEITTWRAAIQGQSKNI